MRTMKKIFILQALLLVLIAVLYLYFDVYLNFGRILWWWDILLHFLGGLWFALLGAFLLSRIGVRVRLLHCLGLALAIGLAWEVFEYIFDLGGSVFMSYRLDTIKDIVDDVLGGGFAYFLIERFRS